MTEPDLIGEVVGYRQWRVTDDLELRAAGWRSKHDTWTPGANTAQCGRLRAIDDREGWATQQVPSPCGDCPGDDCHCGFYGLHDPSDHWYGPNARQARGLMFFATTPDPDPLLSGIIVAWGAMQVHHGGFRAQHARVAALAMPESLRDQAVARAVAEKYGVPLVPAVQIPKIAAEFGDTVPLEMRPEKPKPKTDDLWTVAAGGYTMTWTAPIQWTWGAPVAPSVPPPAPKVSKGARERMKLIEGVKRGSNRQGPPKPKRAPRKL